MDGGIVLGGGGGGGGCSVALKLRRSACIVVSAGM